MRAVRIERPGELDVVDIPAPIAGSGEVVIDVAYAGICASDVEMLAGHRPAEIVAYPVIPGHEWSGVVAAVGDGVDPSLVGRKVVGEGFWRCHGCGRCEHGDANLCETAYDETGFTRPGAWAEQFVLPAEQLWVLDDRADLRSAACLEPAACSADAVMRAGVRPGERVAVVGGGTLGALAVQLLRAARPAEIVVVDPDPGRVDIAMRCGATSVITPAAAADAGEFDAVIEAAGALTTSAFAVELAARGGRVVLVGLPEEAATLSPARLLTKRIELHTVFGAPSAAWRHAVDAFRSGVLDPGILVTHELDLDDAATAFELLGHRDPAVGKILLRPGREQP
jgi:2-desacetyl-2-hydroxyethyl bacteriochlorophyllide A dehydrogenase